MMEINRNDKVVLELDLASDSTFFPVLPNQSYNSVPSEDPYFLH
jgi:hypothetical protein